MSAGAPGTPSLLRHRAGDLFFTNAEGEEVYLAGSHTWTSVQDVDGRAFEWDEFLALQKSIGANITRLWSTDVANDHGVKTPYTFVERGDGRFDLSQVNQDYLDRLVERVADLEAEGMYASIMLFNGWGWHQDDSWWHSPYSGGNNVNGIDAGPDEIMSLSNWRLVQFQENYVRAVVEAVKSFDNVLFEVGNEISNNDDAWAWQRHMLGVIRDADDGGRRPVGVTAAAWWTGPQWKIPGELADSGADWTSPDGVGGACGFADGAPPAADGGQVSIVDTDHIWGIGGSTGFVWEAFTRGHNVWSMDSLEHTGIAGTSWTYPGYAETEATVREGIAQTREAAELLDLRDVREAGWLSSTGFAIANAGSGNYAVYDPDGGSLRLDLSGSGGTLRVRWVELATGEVVDGGAVAGGGPRAFDAPFDGAAALVLTPGARTEPPDPGDGHEPRRIAFGSGPDTLVLHVSQDAFRGDAEYAVSVDGARVGGVFAASALRSAGEHDTLTLRGAWGGGEHTVTVELLNDLWVPGAGDRNLYVTRAIYNGEGSDALGDGWTGGSFTVQGAAGAGGPVSGTEGDDTLVGGAGDDVLNGGAGNDRLAGRGGADVLVFAEGDGEDRVARFLSGVDTLRFDSVDEGSVRVSAATRGGRDGLEVAYGGEGDSIFLVGVAALSSGDIAFA